ncbi:MAG: 2-C-methyl-D-erythritol 2,4-cyclodiphosphate synthase, partial [Candidatus Omnitrophica bacterium]|nr:2-C-methyl-D-erythritol 2,4-cyclodiphosphate synthase [Candidatus Omnitrophota bacterium]
MQYRIGIGYDIHRLVQGRKLILGGVEIPYEKGLEGHSDADVVLHAVCDALLGAVGKGDIGEHFPNTDKQYKDISSMILLEKVYKIIEDQGYQVNNVDVMIQAEEPKLYQYKPQMRFHLAYKLAIDEELVNIKATTHEGLGSIGEKK